MLLGLAEDSRSENAGSFWVHFVLDLFSQRAHPHGGVVVEHHCRLGGQEKEMVEHGFKLPGRLIDQFPLNRRRQRNAQAQLQSLQPQEGHAAAIAHDSDHDPHTGIVFLDSRLRGRRRGKELATGIASQLFHFMDQRRDGRLGDHLDGNGRFLALAQFAFLTVGALLSRNQGGMSHWHPPRSGVTAMGVASMSFGFGLALLLWRLAAYMAGTFVLIAKAKPA